MTNGLRLCATIRPQVRSLATSLCLSSKPRQQREPKGSSSTSSPSPGPSASSLAPSSSSSTPPQRTGPKRDRADPQRSSGSSSSPLSSTKPERPGWSRPLQPLERHPSPFASRSGSTPPRGTDVPSTPPTTPPNPSLTTPASSNLPPSPDPIPIESLLLSLFLAARSTPVPRLRLAAERAVLASVSQLSFSTPEMLSDLVKGLMSSSRALEEAVEVYGWLVRVTKEDGRDAVVRGVLEGAVEELERKARELSASGERAGVSGESRDGS